MAETLNGTPDTQESKEIDFHQLMNERNILNDTLYAVFAQTRDLERRYPTLNTHKQESVKTQLRESLKKSARRIRVLKTKETDPRYHGRTSWQDFAKHWATHRRNLRELTNIDIPDTIF